MAETCPTCGHTQLTEEELADVFDRALSGARFSLDRERPDDPE